MDLVEGLALLEQARCHKEVFMSSLHCSLGSNDNWTDLVTNTTSIEPLRFGVNLRQWLGLGTAPSDQLSVFIHEATHHWCFMSPVACALAALSLRAQRRTLILTQAGHDEDLESLLLDDLIRIQIAMKFLRPFAEGLAAFAEFDAISRVRSTVQSSVMRWVGVLYMDPASTALDMGKVPAEVAIDVNLATVICRLRQDSATLDRKASLLLDPFRADAGGYLPGYLSVKSLWRTLGRQCHRVLSETDLFLMYLRSFIYDDLGFVATLLDPTTQERRTASPIVNHISRRLNQFSEMTESEVNAYEQSLIHNFDIFKINAGIGVSESDAVQGRRLFDDILSELNEPKESAGSYEDTLRWYGFQMLSRRQFLNLGSLDVQVTVTETGKVIAHDGSTTLHEGRVLDMSRTLARSSHGTLEVVFSMQRNSLCRAIVVTQEAKVVSCEVLGPNSQVLDTQNAIQHTFIRRRQILELDGVLSSATEEVISGRWIQYELDHIMAQVNALIDGFYQDIALRFARDYEAIDTCAALMRDRGLYPLLRTSRQIRGAALVGIACSLDPHLDAVTGCFSAAGLDLSETLTELQRSYNKHGFPPQILVAGGSVFSTI
jgi:hypothetical protein